MRKAILLILLTVLLSYGLTVFMYFGQDDHGLMFKIQNIEEGFSQYGEGLTGRKSSSPYRYMATPFAPLYPLFETDPFGYFAIGVFNYFLASLAVYFLARTLAKKNVALVIALIFASGYVGSDTMLRLTNSYQTPHAIVFMCVTAALYKKFIDKKSILLYLLAIGAYAATVEGFWIRSHGLILVILGLEALYNFSFPWTIVRSVPFLWVFYSFYVKGSPSTGEVSAYFDLLLKQGKFRVLLVPLRSLVNLIIPDTFIAKDGLLAAALTLIFASVLFLVLLWRRNKMMWVGIAFAVASYMVYIFHFPERVISTTHRYATIPFVGVALFLGGFIYEVFGQKKWFWRAAFVVVVFNVIQMNSYSLWNLKMRNNPTRNFYETLTSEIRVLPRQSAIYFDVQDDAESRRLRGEFFSVGSAPEMSAVAYYYGIDRYDLYLPENFDELLSLVKQGRVKPDRVYTFYFDAKRGLINTTNRTRESLFGGKSGFGLIGDIGNINLDFSSPLLLSLDGDMSVDYEVVSGNVSGNLGDYLGYLTSRKEYYKASEAAASSEWKYRESWNILDEDFETSWMSSRYEWLERKEADVTVDMGREIEVGAAKIYYGSEVRVPLEYEYLCSRDGKSWTSLGWYGYEPSGDGMLFDKFPAERCRFVKLLVTRTQIDDSPQISELEIVESRYSVLDPEVAKSVEKSPNLFALSVDDRDAVDRYLREYGIEAEVCYITDKYNPELGDCHSFNVLLGGRHYEIIIPGGGTSLRSIMFQNLKGISFKVGKAEIKPLTFDELDQREYIPNYTHEY